MLVTSALEPRDLERLLVVLGGILFAYLGYRLFLFGVKEGNSHLEAESKGFRIIFSGTAPGLFFMFAGLVVLVAVMFSYVTTQHSSTESTQTALVPASTVPGSPA